MYTSKRGAQELLLRVLRPEEVELEEVVRLADGDPLLLAYA